MINKDILKQIGFTDYEAEIYLALLVNGQLSAYELAEKAGLYRQVTYDSLKRLEEKGFVSSVINGKTKIFKATDPKIILELLNEKVESFNQIMPQLLGLTNASKQPLSVETYKGKNILRIALRDIINHLRETKHKEVLCTAVDEYLPLEKFELVVKQYERDLVHYKIKERVIIKEGTKGIFKKGTSQYKKIPIKFFNENPIQIYGANVQIIVLGNPDYLIIIRNKNVAEAYRKQFELLWKIAKK
ncbi:MAG: helix-turn-helix domain-containing protein [Nanoarchaeota archaeon]|nr:helix-turn-helix domain-containing protein [Nanoarchaeota archaeon]